MLGRGGNRRPLPVFRGGAAQRARGNWNGVRAASGGRARGRGRGGRFRGGWRGRSRFAKKKAGGGAGTGGASSSYSSLGQNVTFQLISPTQAAITCEPYSQLVHTAIKNVAGFTMRPPRHGQPALWCIPFERVIDTQTKLKALGIKLHFNVCHPHLLSKASRPFHTDPFDSSILPSHLYDCTLYDFQKEGVKYAVERQGRVLIGDEMGLGKSIQAIAVASYFQKEWPILVICPSSLRLTWQAEFVRWLPDMHTDHTKVVFSGKDSIVNDKHTKITIVSYDLTGKHLQKLLDHDFQIVICDESHYIKNSKAQRTQSVLKLLQNANRKILLSGTPALSRPFELYTQVNALMPGVFGTERQFGMRYCGGRMGPFGFEYKGANNLTELHYVLKRYCMIRRKKSEVLRDLPAKRRTAIVSKVNSREINSLMKKAGDLNELLQETVSRDDASERVTRDRFQALAQLYVKTGEAKITATNAYLSDLLEGGAKFLVFAHHQKVLDGIEDHLKKLKVVYCRIDGKTSPKARHANVERFQTDDSLRVCVISITAGGQGITLTAANTVVFAELYWTPAILLQAEDRVHRIGQQDAVHISYVIGRGTLDDTMWPLISTKLAVLGSALDGKQDFMKVDRFGPRQSMPLPPSATKRNTAAADGDDDFIDPMDPMSYTPKKRAKPSTGTHSLPDAGSSQRPKAFIGAMDRFVTRTPLATQQPQQQQGTSSSSASFSSSSSSSSSSASKRSMSTLSSPAHYEVPERFQSDQSYQYALFVDMGYPVRSVCDALANSEKDAPDAETRNATSAAFISNVLDQLNATAAVADADAADESLIGSQESLDFEFDGFSSQFEKSSPLKPVRSSSSAFKSSNATATPGRGFSSSSSTPRKTPQSSFLSPTFSSVSTSSAPFPKSVKPRASPSQSGATHSASSSSSSAPFPKSSVRTPPGKSSSSSAGDRSLRTVSTPSSRATTTTAPSSSSTSSRKRPRSPTCDSSNRSDFLSARRSGKPPPPTETSKSELCPRGVVYMEDSSDSGSGSGSDTEVEEHSQLRHRKKNMGSASCDVATSSVKKGASFSDSFQLRKASSSRVASTWKGFPSTASSSSSSNMDKSSSGGRNNSFTSTASSSMKNSKSSSMSSSNSSSGGGGGDKQTPRAPAKAEERFGDRDGGGHTRKKRKLTLTRTGSSDKLVSQSARKSSSDAHAGERRRRVSLPHSTEIIDLS